MKQENNYWQKVLNGDFPSRLQIALSEPIASDLIVSKSHELAAAHKEMHEILIEQSSFIWDEGWDHDLRPESNIVSLKLEILERWFSYKGLSFDSGWSLLSVEKPKKCIRLFESEKNNFEPLEKSITKSYDKGSLWMDVQIKKIEKLPSLLMSLKNLEINIPIRAVCDFEWSPVPVSLLTWLFDEILINSKCTDDIRKGPNLPGMREAKMLSLAGENVILVMSIQDSEREWEDKLNSWSKRNKITLLLK
tara:strand:- start:3949 stop:4695 length:747 start_codon:yes stop_codon:yes gene_type:complete